MHEKLGKYMEQGPVPDEDIHRMREEYLQRCNEGAIQGCNDEGKGKVIPSAKAPKQPGPVWNQPPPLSHPLSKPEPKQPNDPPPLACFPIGASLPPTFWC